LPITASYSRKTPICAVPFAAQSRRPPIAAELEAGAAELETAQTRLAELDQTERPLRITTKFVRQTIDGLNGILDHAP
jgi:hypothetical protein